MKKVLYILLIILAAGCSKSDPVALEEQVAVSFESNYDWPEISDITTRGYTKTGFAEGDEMGIFAYYLNAGESIEEITPNYMYNQLATLEQGDDSFEWVYSPVKYWPTNPLVSLQFFAYYPYYPNDDDSTEDEDGVEIEITSPSSQIGYPSIYFRQAIDLAEQVDFMTAKTDPLVKCDVISLPFEHQLTQVSFAARHNGVESDLIYVTDMDLTINGALVALNGIFTEDGFSAVTAEDDTKVDLEYTLTTTNDLLLSGYAFRIPPVADGFYRTVNSSLGTLMLPPQVIAENSVTITVTLSINRGWNDEDEDPLASEKVIELTVPSSHEYIAGSVVLYQFTLDLETSEVGMDIDNIVREVWNDAGEDVGVESEDSLEGEGGSIW